MVMLNQVYCVLLGAARQRGPGVTTGRPGFFQTIFKRGLHKALVFYTVHPIRLKRPGFVTVAAPLSGIKLSISQHPSHS
jgi:hypothetical protein